MDTPKKGLLARLRGKTAEHDHVVLKPGEVRRLVASLEIPTPFTLDAMLRVVAERIRSRVTMTPYPGDVVEQARRLGQPLPAAMCVPADEGFHIFYRPEMSSEHRRHSVLHEFGHLLCRHTIPEMGIGRTYYDDAREEAAESFAYLVEDRIGPVRASGGADDPAVDRFSILEG